MTRTIIEAVGFALFVGAAVACVVFIHAMTGACQ